MYPKNKENENMFNSHKGSGKEDGQTVKSKAKAYITTQQFYPTFSVEKKIGKHEPVILKEEKAPSFFPKPEVKKDYSPIASLKRSKKKQYVNKTNQEWLHFKKEKIDPEKVASESKLFAKMLKKKQLQQYISNYQSSQRTYNYFMDKILEQETKDDREKLERMRLDVYASPVPEKNKVTKVDASVSMNDSEVMEMLNSKIKARVEQELKNLIQEQKKQNQQNKETMVTPSLNRTEKIRTPHVTPPGKTSVMSRIASACSRAKKLFTSCSKNQKLKKKNLEIHSLSDHYRELFEEPKQKENIQIQTEDQIQEKIQFGIQTQSFTQSNTPLELTDDEANEKEQPTEYLKEQNHSNQLKESRAARVARIRKEAANQNRSKSRTPIKNRLRGYKKK